MLMTLPNVLTLSRILVIPALVGAFYLDRPLSNWVTAALFTAAGLTDFLDGYLARSWQQVTNLGRFLDPVADKVMVAVAIFMMLAFGPIAGWLVLPALVILCREIVVSGLREFLAEIHVGVPVSRLAKWKTTLQMVALGLLLWGEAGQPFIPTIFLGTWALWIAAALTLLTGYDYLRTGLRHMTGTPGPGEGPGQ